MLISKFSQNSAFNFVSADLLEISGKLLFTHLTLIDIIQAVVRKPVEKFSENMQSQGTELVKKMDEGFFLPVSDYFYFVKIFSQKNT